MNEFVIEKSQIIYILGRHDRYIQSNQVYYNVNLNCKNEFRRYDIYSRFSSSKETFKYVQIYPTLLHYFSYYLIDVFL